ncbi:Caffeine dehydrogenase subunit gamma (plasmid) [Roseovarius sp. THAF9]|uniref:(2Fe-2S)-binding protein n=1 Tax=Roseovarius sp. THAF9 TaxID=2587847 RepID=UPI0012685458|nr:(2Fe-2S)-binding protein [Roseovarius sp. THAF9]QFT95560.1 Caffeine dehydrogenase subunit gamma [Roseovarius sp. THAF9]
MSEITQTVTLRVNGELQVVTVPTRKHLADLLREDLGFTSVHVGCEHGVCGSCTVRIDGAIQRSCLVLGVQAEGAQVETLEYLSTQDTTGDLVEAFVSENALQCGFCTPGMIISCAALLAETPSPSREQVRDFLSGNYCRCTGYQAIVEAVMKVAAARRIEIGEKV